MRGYSPWQSRACRPSVRLVAMCARSVYVVIWPIGGGLVAMDEYAKMGKTTVYSPAEGQSQTVIRLYFTLTEGQ